MPSIYFVITTHDARKFEMRIVIKVYIYLNLLYCPTEKIKNILCSLLSIITYQYKLPLMSF